MNYRNETIKLTTIVLFCMSLYVFGLFEQMVWLRVFVKGHYAFLHTLLEFSSIFVAFSIAVQGWLFYKNSPNGSAVAFSIFFFAVGMFDLFHTVSFKGATTSLASVNNTSIWFWFFARFTETILFLIFLTRIKSKMNPAELRLVMAVMTLLYSISVTVILFIYAPYMPLLQNDHQPTELKTVFEVIFAAMHAVIFVHAVRLMKKSNEEEYFYVAAASVLLVFTSIAIFYYESIDELQNLMAHVFKLVSYIYLFRLVFIHYGKKPFQQMEELSSTYRKLLNNVVEGIYGIDTHGKITFVNASATKMLGYREDELVGREAHPLIHHTKTDGTDYFVLDCPICQVASSGQELYIANDLFWRKDGTSIPVEFFTRPLIESEEIVGTIITFLDISAKKQLEDLQSTHKNTEHEIQLAAVVQQSLLSPIHNMSISNQVGWVSIPFKTLNGDFYTIVPKEDSLSIAIADVCGKGIPAAIQMTMMKFAMELGYPPERVLSEINDFFCLHMDDSTFITMFVGVLDKNQNEIQFASAGHEPAIVYRKSENTFMELTAPGPLIGLFPSMDYQAGSFQAKEGDILILYTDGIIERREYSKDSNEHIKDAVKEIDLSLSAQEITEILYDRIMDFHGGKVEDDQTLLVLKI